MELKYLHTLKTILETGSFVAAAKQLNYTQSTVTFQVQQLERELSIKLFEKIGRRMVLTQAGRDILPYVDVILENVAQLENYGKESHELRGVLRVAIPETLLTYKMQPLLRAYREQAPHVKLSLQPMNCYKIPEQVIHGGVDIGIHYDVGGYSSSVVIEKLAEYEVCVLASPILDEKECDFMTPNQRKAIYLLTNDTDSVYYEMFDEYLREKNIVIEGVHELGSVEAIKRSVMSNLGIICLPRFVVEENLARNEFKEIRTGIDGRSITSICVYHKNKWITPAMELFMRLLKEHLVE